MLSCRHYSITAAITAATAAAVPLPSVVCVHIATSAAEGHYYRYFHRQIITVIKAAPIAAAIQ